MNLRDKLERYASKGALQSAFEQARNETVSVHGRSTLRPYSQQTEAYAERVRHIFPSHHTHGSVGVHSLGGWFEKAASVLRCDADSLDFQRIAFLDTETTGLSGGIGVCAFLVGVGHVTPDGFVVEQFLMHDFPAEREMLERVCEMLEQFDVIASYNGRAFDIPILEGRLLLNGIRKKLNDRPHLDLLHPARRLWKHRVGDCSLKSLESHALGYVRVGDIDGWLIPDTYFRYVRSGDRTLLESVLEHNRLDVLSLACLAHLVFAAVENPQEPPLTHGPDLFGLGTLFEQHRRMDDAARCFARAMEVGLPQELKVRCVRSLSLAHKRAGAWNDAVKLWEQASKKGGADALFELEELAKFYEHRKRDPFSAREVCRRAIAMLEIRDEISGTDSAGQLERLEHRLRRIERKIKRLS
ncbi:MAG: hypothetical protein Kow0099_01970 [Candidatus Abyssubacteria bacterium]